MQECEGLCALGKLMAELLLATFECGPCVCVKINGPPQQPTGEEEVLWSLYLCRKSQVDLSRICCLGDAPEEVQSPPDQQACGLATAFLKLDISELSPAVLSGKPHPRPLFIQRPISDADSHCHQPLPTGESDPEGPGHEGQQTLGPSVTTSHLCICLVSCSLRPSLGRLQSCSETVLRRLSASTGSTLARGKLLATAGWALWGRVRFGGLGSGLTPAKTVGQPGN